MNGDFIEYTLDQVYPGNKLKSITFNKNND